LKRRRTSSRKERARRKKRAQRTPPAQEPKPTEGSRQPQFSLPNRTQLKALRERFDKNQLLPEDYPVLAEIVEFRDQLPELLRQKGMTVERLKKVMGLTESETLADEAGNEPNCQPSREADSPDNVDTGGDGS
jgi:hypothetical protein